MSKDLSTEKKNKIFTIFQTLDYNNANSQEKEPLTLINDATIFEPKQDKSTLLINGSLRKSKLSTVTDEQVEKNLKVLEEVTKKNIWKDIAPLNRARKVQLFAKKVQNNLALINNLAKVFNIPECDAKSAISLLVDYLDFYSLCGDKCPSTWKPNGIVVAILDEKNSLSALGSILGPVLIWGYNVIIHVPLAIFELATILKTIATSAGIPAENISIFNENEFPVEKLVNHENVEFVLIFDDLYKAKYNFTNSSNTKILHFSSSGAPMLIFESADLDSAASGIIEAAWSYYGLMPWTVRNIFVQENIFELFLKKFKKILLRGVDISTPSYIDPESYLQRYNQIIHKAKEQGIEIIEAPTNSEIFKPIILLGGNTTQNNLLENYSFDFPLVTITAFRTIKEGVALANNTRNGLAASVWSENVSLVHEVVEALQVGQLWINSHGLFAADVPISPFKYSGNGYIGGIDGLYEFMTIKPKEQEHQVQSNISCNIGNIVNEIKKAQHSWAKLSKLQRAKKLQNVVNENEDDGNNWFSLVSDYASNSNGETFYKKDQYDVVVRRQARGIVVVEAKEDIIVNKKLILAALLEGNAVIILINTEKLKTLYLSLEKQLAKYLVAIFQISSNILEELLRHSDIRVCFTNYSNKGLPIKFSHKIKNLQISNKAEHVRGCVTLTKNIWYSNKGQSV